MMHLPANAAQIDNCVTEALAQEYLAYGCYS